MPRRARIGIDAADAGHGSVVVHLPCIGDAGFSNASQGDPRYRDLLGRALWLRLPVAVQRRFSKRIGVGGVRVYRGEVVVMELSRAGWMLAQVARLVGGPLPHTNGALGPSVVAVADEPAFRGQIWTRSYARPRRFPQVIHSAKRFTGPTGLEEYLGCGLVMRLVLSVEGGELVFRSRGYAIEVAGRTIGLPHWLAPGRCEVRHRAETDERFSFTLTLVHPWLGTLLRQVAFYEDDAAGH